MFNDIDSEAVSLLMWNTRNHKITGLEASQHDEIQVFDEDRQVNQTSYSVYSLISVEGFNTML